MPKPEESKIRVRTEGDDHEFRRMINNSTK